MQADYPESEFPWTFYFNGESLPKWANCWNACDMFDLARKEIDDWDQAITSRDLYLLCCRIDHVGTVESEDSARLQLLAMTLIKVMMTSEAAIQADISKWTRESLRDRGAIADAREIYDGILEGLFKMVQLSERDSASFWTTGYEADRDHLLTFMSRTRLPQDHPEHWDPPHIRRARSDAYSQYERLRKEIISVLHPAGAAKDVRRAVYELPRLREAHHERGT